MLAHLAHFLTRVGLCLAHVGLVLTRVRLVLTCIGTRVLEQT